MSSCNQTSEKTSLVMAAPIHHRMFAWLLTAFHFIRVGSLLLVYFITQPFGKLMKERPIPPKCLTDPKHGQHKYANVNGIKLHYVEKGDPSKPLMLFIHGFPEFWYSWRYQLEEFSKDYWCVAVDNRGYGDSEKPTSKDAYKIENILEDIKELVTFLGKERFILVGHDWGGVIAWRFVDIYGSMLDKFITMSGPSSEVWIHLVFSEWWQFAHAWYVFFFQNLWFPEITIKMNDMAMLDKALRDGDNSTVTAEDVEAYKYTFGKEGALTPPIDYYRQNFMKIYKRPKNSNVPRGLYILGELDAYISRTSIELQKERYEGLQTILLKRAKHFIQQEKPKEVNAAIRSFLES